MKTQRTQSKGSITNDGKRSKTPTEEKRTLSTQDEEKFKAAIARALVPKSSNKQAQVATPC